MKLIKEELSIIIPAFNEEKYIKDTINSILSSNYDLNKIEIIVVANGCTDKTEKIAEKFDGKVKLYSIRQKGVSNARNLGAKKSSSEILIFLDADTLVSKNALKRIYHYANLDMSGTLSVLPHPKKTIAMILFTIKNIWYRMGLYDGINGILFVKKNIFNKTKGFDTKLDKREDKDILEEILKYSKYKFIYSAYAATSIRRYEKLGYYGVIKYWVTTWIKMKLGQRVDKYPVVR